MGYAVSYKPKNTSNKPTRPAGRKRIRGYRSRQRFLMLYRAVRTLRGYAVEWDMLGMSYVTRDYVMKKLALSNNDVQQCIMNKWLPKTIDKNRFVIKEIITYADNMENLEQERVERLSEERSR